MMAPIKEIKSEDYLIVLKDALGITHYWSKDGHYDGYSVSYENDYED